MEIKVPKVAFIHQWQNRVYMKKVLLDQLIQQISRRNPQTTLKLEKVEIMRGNVVNVVNIEEWVVAVENIGGRFGILGMYPVIINTTGGTAGRDEVFQTKGAI